MRRGNLRAALPADLPAEVTSLLVETPGVRIERILSRGQTTGWYDQEENETVFLLEGGARLELEAGEIELGPGDWLEIPAHLRHRVSWTDPDRVTIWLAVFHR
jgi:cupin 2 domain-containing protein